MTKEEERNVRLVRSGRALMQDIARVLDARASPNELADEVVYVELVVMSLMLGSALHKAAVMGATPSEAARTVAVNCAQAVRQTSTIHARDCDDPGCKVAELSAALLAELPKALERACAQWPDLSEYFVDDPLAKKVH